LETLIIKETLRSKLNTGVEPAVDFLYNSYSSMLYGYVLQFVPDKKEAEKVLVLVFGKLSARLQEACNSPLSVYCWMQVEARKVILEYKDQAVNGHAGQPDAAAAGSQHAYYLSLLQEASDDQRMVFSELFLKGRDREELAGQLQKTVHDITRLLRESLLIMRKNLQ
jgi:hypothetical protein